MDDKDKKRKAVENERRIEHLRNIVEKQTRSERHLEEHSDTSKSPENIAHVKQLQREREHEIQNLKNIIAYGENHNEDHLENTKKRLQYTEGYLNHNADHMDRETLENTKRKQEHRREQIDQLK